MFKRLYFAMILAGSLFGSGACDRHDWEKTRSLHQIHGHGEHQEHGNGAPGGTDEATHEAEKHGEEAQTPETGGGDATGAESRKKEPSLRHMGM
jgi:hypothetical protein